MSKIEAHDTLLCSEPQGWSDMYTPQSDAPDTYVHQLQILVINCHLQRWQGSSKYSKRHK